MGGIGAALLFGIILAGAMELRDTTMKSDRDVEYYLQTKNLATVPVLALPAEASAVSRKSRIWMIGSVPVVLLVAGASSSGAPAATGLLPEQAVAPT